VISTAFIHIERGVFFGVCLFGARHHRNTFMFSNGAFNVIILTKVADPSHALRMTKGEILRMRSG
jgi:hypothetical protein